MATNNSINNVAFPYYFEYTLSTDQLNVTGDSTVFQIPFDTYVKGPGVLSAGVFTAPVDGIWTFGCRINLTSNYATWNHGGLLFETFNDSNTLYPQGGPGPNAFYTIYTLVQTFYANATGIVLTAGQTTSVTIKGQGSTKTLGVLATIAKPTAFWGYLEYAL